MRPVRRDDLPELTRILKETGAFTVDEVDCALELLNNVLDDPTQKDYYVTVIEEGGKPAGYILFGPVPLTEGTWDIYWVATDPVHHGKGFGRKLFERTESDLRVLGARMICLETSSQGSYMRTRRFYEQAGYTEASRIRDFYRPGDDRLTYVKRLSDAKEH